MIAAPITPRSRFGIRFALLARRWRQSLDAHLAEAGLSDATWVPLVHLHESGGGITQKDLAALVGIDSSSLVRLLDILCRQGLAERRVDASLHLHGALDFPVGNSRPKRTAACRSPQVSRVRKNRYLPHTVAFPNPSPPPSNAPSANDVCEKGTSISSWSVGVGV